MDNYTAMVRSFILPFLTFLFIHLNIVTFLLTIPGGSKANLASLNQETSASLFASPRIRPRLPIGKPKILLAIGGQAPKAIRSVEGYDFKEDRWVNISEMPNRRCRCGVAVVKG